MSETDPLKFAVHPDKPWAPSGSGISSCVRSLQHLFSQDLESKRLISHLCSSWTWAFICLKLLIIWLYSLILYWMVSCGHWLSPALCFVLLKSSWRSSSPRISTTFPTHTHLPLKWRESLKGLLRRALRDKICPLWPPLFFFCCLGSRCRWWSWQSARAVDYTRRLNWAEARHPVLQQHRRRLKSPRAVDFFTSEDSPQGAVKLWSILCLRALFNTNMTVWLVSVCVSRVRDMAALLDGSHMD